MTRIALVLVSLTAALVLAGQALACSCAPGDPRDMLELSDGAFTGTLLERVVEGDQAIHTFRVDHAVKGEIGETVQVRSHRDGATCGLEIGIGQRVGLFLDREGAEWLSTLCQQIDPDELLAAAQPLPEPDGSGPIAMLVGGSFGDMRTVALDARGRLLGYGPGDGDVVALSVCPGSEQAVELVMLPFEDGGGYAIDVRDLETMAVSGRLGDPRDFATAYPETLRCLDRGGTAAVVFTRDFGDSPRPDRLLRVAAGTSEVLWQGSAWSASFDGRRAYVCTGRRGMRAVAVSLTTGRETFLGKLPAFVGPLSPSPDGRHLAGVAFSSPVSGEAPSRAVVLDLTTGRSRSAPLGAPYVTGEMLWLSPKRVVFAPERSFDRIRVFSPTLRLLARGELLAASDAELAGGRLVALAAPFVVEASPPSGRLRELTRLPSPVGYALEPVANGPAVRGGRTPAGALANAPGV
jgi:hypothetical protein